MTLDSTVLLYTYISRFSVNLHYISRGRKSGKAAAINFIPNRFLSRFSISLTNGPRSLSQAKVGTHSPFRERLHTTAYTAKHGAFRTGVVSLPSDRFACFGNPARPGVRTANFAAFGSWSGGALEERRKPSGQRCAHACRCSAGVAAPLGCAVLMPLFVQYDLEGWKDLTKRSGRVTITRNNRTTSRLALVWEPLRAVK